MNIIQRDPSKRIKDPNDRELKGESKFEANKNNTFGSHVGGVTQTCWKSIEH